MAGSIAQQVGEVGVEAPRGDGELLQCRHAAGARAQGRQVERSACSVQHCLGILKWTLNLIGRHQARYSRLIG